MKLKAMWARLHHPSLTQVFVGEQAVLLPFNKEAYFI